MALSTPAQMSTCVWQIIPASWQPPEGPVRIKEPVSAQVRWIQCCIKPSCRGACDRLVAWWRWTVSTCSVACTICPPHFVVSSL